MAVKTVLIGAGGMARHHLPRMIETGADIIVVCEPSSDQYEQTCAKLEILGAPIPPNEPDLSTMLDK